MKPTVYIETTIPSYYFDKRPEIAADIERTRQWWDVERGEYECFIAEFVLDELAAGEYVTKDRCLQLVSDIPMLKAVPEVLEIADIYQVHKLMPAPPSIDALHLAIASYYRMNYLLTWNCRHLANVRKAEHLEQINATLHLGLPRLVTPQNLRSLEEMP